MESDGMDQQNHLGDQSTSLLDPSLQMGSFGDGESNVWNHEFLLQNRNMQGYSVNEQVLTQTPDHQSYSTDISSHQVAAKNQQILPHQNYNLLDDRVDSPSSVSRVGSWPMHVNSFQSQPGFEFSLLQPGYNTNVKQELMGIGSYPSTSMPPASYYQELSKQESHKLSGESACFTNPNKIVSFRPQQEYNMSSHGMMQPFFPTSKPSHDMLNTTMPMLDFLASQSMDMRQRLTPTSYMQDCKPKLHDLQNKIIGESPECSSEQKRNKDSSGGGGGTNKKPRMDSSVSSSSSSSPSVPSFKLCLQVRKEKLGDRITALQQLVSPFGKTDTASVLLEAIGYIKFLQEQVRTLSTPYMEAVAATQGDSESDEPRGDLRSRGLCLVPISYTMHVANENGADFWSPNLGAAFR